MLIDGYTLIHEHVFIDLSKMKKNLDCRLDCKKETIEEFKKLYSQGFRNIIDVTNIGMGRDIKYIMEVAQESKMNIVCSTGCYKDPVIPEYILKLTTEEIADLFCIDIEKGIDNTSVKAEIIGEIGTSLNIMTENEKRIFEAAVIAHKRTNKPISTHTTLGTYAKEQIEFFKNRNVDLSKVIIGHVDLSGDIDYILNILENGVYVSFDTIGKENYLSDEKRIEMLIEIEKTGFIDKVFLSMDITRKSNMSYKGGIGYCYLYDNFINLAQKKGLSKTSIEKLLRKNPNQFFNF